MFGIPSLNQIWNSVLCLRLYVCIPEAPRRSFSRHSRIITKEAYRSKEGTCWCSSAPSIVCPSSGRLRETVIKSFRKSKNFARKQGNVWGFIQRTYWSELRWDHLGREVSGSPPQPSCLIVVDPYIFLYHQASSWISFTWMGTVSVCPSRMLLVAVTPPEVSGV